MILDPSSDTQDAVEPMAQLLTGLTCDLLGGQGPVSLNVCESAESTQLILRVAPEHLDRLLGPHGRTAESLRVIVRAAGIQQGRRFDLVIDQAVDESQSVDQSHSEQGMQGPSVRTLRVH